MAAEAQSPPPQVDPQDPLPESNWFWRRFFIFVLCGAVLAGVYVYTDSLSQAALKLNETAIKGLITLLKESLGIIAILVLFYLISPSAEQVIKMLATLSAWKSGVSTTSTSRAVSSDGSIAEATKSAGPAVGAPSQPAPPQVAAYAGPALSDIPPPDPSTPEEPKWPR